MSSLLLDALAVVVAVAVLASEFSGGADASAWMGWGLSSLVPVLAVSLLRRRRAVRVVSSSALAGFLIFVGMTFALTGGFCVTTSTLALIGSVGQNHILSPLAVTFPAGVGLLSLLIGSTLAKSVVYGPQSDDEPAGRPSAVLTGLRIGLAAALIVAVIAGSASVVATSHRFFEGGVLSSVFFAIPCVAFGVWSIWRAHRARYAPATPHAAPPDVENDVK